MAETPTPEELAKVLEEKVEELVLMVLPNSSVPKDITKIGKLSTIQHTCKFSIVNILRMFSSNPNRRERRKIQKILN
jgi:hypothetical protein